MFQIKRLTFREVRCLAEDHMAKELRFELRQAGSGA